MPYASKQITKNGVKPLGSNLLGTCSTAGGTATKVVNMSDFDVLVEGVTIHVYFTYKNSAETPQLQVGSTSATPIKCNGEAKGIWDKGGVVSFTYHNGYWVQNDVNGSGDGLAFYRKIESYYTTTNPPEATIPINITNFTTADMLIVDINGLTLANPEDYTISGTNIVLTTPIQYANQTVHFIALRAVLAGPQDYAALKGDPGDSAGFGQVTASVDNNVGTPSVQVTASGPDTAKEFDFAFHNLKGDTGATGTAAGFGTPTASVDANIGTPSVQISASGPDTAKVFDFAFHNLKGQKGDAGVVDAYPISGATPLSAGWLSETSGGTALTPQSDQIYILMSDSGDYSANTMFRWNGSAYEPLTSGAEGHKEMAQTDYDNLTQAEKEDGTVYFVYDGQPDYLIVNDSVPIGAIQSYGGATAPENWLICDGSAVSRTDYSELFAVIGTTFGSGDGSTTFNLPDVKGRVLLGVGESTATGHTAHTLGQKDGEETHTLIVNEIPSHSHNMGYSWSAGIATYWGFALGPKDSVVTNPSEVSGGGGDQSHNNMQPYLAVNIIIKAKEPQVSQIIDNIDPQGILLSVFYPVGSYYETSDVNFDPNTAWGGTWVLESGGGGTPLKWNRRG